MTGARVFVSAGEPSGDLHGGALVRELRSLVPSVRFEGMGGGVMRAAGVDIDRSIDQASLVGLAEILGGIPGHWRHLREVERRLRAGRYDLVILIDYPGLNLRIAQAARAAGVPVLYYIAPQLWAWGAHRMAAFRRAVTRLAVILRFEQDFFRERGVAASFVGHPLLDRPPAPAPAAARARLGIPEAAPVLSLFPGSRLQEVKRLWPVFRDAAHHVRATRPEVTVVVSRIDGYAYPGGGRFTFRRGESATLLAAADATLCKSGTTTLEAALHGVPTVIAYRLHPLTYAAARRVVRVPHVGLTNLLAGRAVSPELIQGNATPTAMAEALLPLLDPGSVEATGQRRALSEVRGSLGTPGAARRVAILAQSLLS